MKFSQKRRIYLNAFRALPEVARKRGLTPQQYALQVIKEKRPQIEQYVKNGGNKPSKDDFILSTQATLTHENNVAREMRLENTDYNTAEENVFLIDQMREAQNFNDDYEDFAPALLAVVGAVGGKGIEAINAKRTHQGKKPILSGKFWDSFRNKTKGVSVGTEGDRLIIGIDGKPTTAAEPNTAAGAAIEAMQRQLETEAKKDYLRRNLPVIIILAALAIAAFLYFKKK